MVVRRYFYSMLPIVHFIISIGIAFSLEIRHPRKYAVILLLGVIGMMPDIDHMFSTSQNTGMFHNTLFLGVLPLAIVIFAHLFEASRENESSEYQRFFISVTVILLGHLILDLIAGNEISLGLTSTPLIFSIPSVPLVQSGIFGTLISTVDILWVSLFALVVSGNFALKKVYALFEDYNAEEEVKARRIPMTGIFKRPVRSNMDISNLE